MWRKIALRRKALLLQGQWHRATKGSTPITTRDTPVTGDSLITAPIMGAHITRPCITLGSPLAAGEGRAMDVRGRPQGIPRRAGGRVVVDHREGALATPRDKGKGEVGSHRDLPLGAQAQARAQRQQARTRVRVRKQAEDDRHGDRQGIGGCL